MQIYQAVLESEHFTFDAYASTEKSARRTLLDALQRHAMLMKIEVEWYKTGTYDVRVRKIVLGQGYRDGETFGPVTDPHR